jgi:uncharacterized protein
MGVAMKKMKSRLVEVIVARCEVGEDLYASLDRLVRENGVASGSLQVIGALSQCRLGIFEDGAYEWVEHEGALEIASCTGNVSLKDGSPFVHAHAVLTDHHGLSLGGHVGDGCIVNPTAEIHLSVYEEPISRRLDAATGLWILDI